MRHDAQVEEEEQLPEGFSDPDATPVHNTARHLEVGHAPESEGGAGDEGEG